MPVPRSIDGQGQSPEAFTSGGVTIKVNPGNTPAQDWENQYGELGGEAGGALNMLDDYLRTNFGVSAGQARGIAEAILIPGQAKNLPVNVPRWAEEIKKFLKGPKPRLPRPNPARGRIPGRV